MYIYLFIYFQSKLIFLGCCCCCCCKCRCFISEFCSLLCRRSGQTAGAAGERNARGGKKTHQFTPKVFTRCFTSFACSYATPSYACETSRVLVNQSAAETLRRSVFAVILEFRVLCFLTTIVSCSQKQNWIFKCWITLPRICPFATAESFYHLLVFGKTWYVSAEITQGRNFSSRPNFSWGKKKVGLSLELLRGREGIWRTPPGDTHSKNSEPQSNLFQLLRALIPSVAVWLPYLPPHIPASCFHFRLPGLFSNS